MNAIKLVVIFTSLLFVRNLDHRSPYSLQIDCAIYDLNGRLQKLFPEYLCYFYNDGSRLSLRPGFVDGNEVVEGTIAKYSGNDELIWKLKTEPHHELAVTSENKILFISSELGTLENRNIRFDVLNILNSDGTYFAKWSTKDHVEEIKKMMEAHNREMILNNAWSKQEVKDLKEFTHINSFKEIPANKKYPKLKWLKPGNFIVGANCLNFFFIFDHDLKKIEKVIDYGGDQVCGTHDVQVLPNGNILHYRNVDKYIDQQSSLVELDSETERVVWAWPKSNLNFFNPMLGSIQRLDNGYTVFSDNVSTVEEGMNVKGSRPNVKLIDKNGEIVSFWQFEMKGNKEMYRARLIKLDEFLKNNFH